MPTDYSSLKRMDPLDLSRSGFAQGKSPVEALVRLKEGASAPSYITARAWFGETLFSTQITQEELRRLEADPSVINVEPARKLPLIR